MITPTTFLMKKLNFFLFTIKCIRAIFKKNSGDNPVLLSYNPMPNRNLSAVNMLHDQNNENWMGKKEIKEANKLLNPLKQETALKQTISVFMYFN